MWSRRFDCCVECGTTVTRHRSQGLCSRCYNKRIELRHKDVQRQRGIAARMLTKQFLIEEYCNRRKSLSEIARMSSCSRQYVYKKMREYGISLRNKSRARKLALRQRKVTAMRFDAAGQRHDIMYHKIDVNERFFNSWSREMAYVLGIIYTDGNLQAPKKMNTNKRDYSRVARVSIGQKEPEILQKILRLMSCNAKLYFSPQREYKNAVAGKLYYISIGSNQLYDALSRIGLKPKKSRDIRFPDMPEECVRHFIRGCWDGDGSVYIECRQDRLVASYVCGSYAFIEDLLVHLEKAGLPKRNIYETKRGERASYYFKYSGRQCNQLYHYLYDDVPPAQYLERKYLLFKKYCDRSLNQSQLFRQAD